MSKVWKARFTAAAVIAAVGIATVEAQAADFYAGKRVTVVIGSTTGGGYDQFGRLLSRHIGKYIPGNPSAIARNMPGASGIEAMRYIYAKAAKDGTEIAITLRNAPFETLTTGKNTGVDPTKFTWIGSMNSETSLCVSWHSSPFKTLQDIQSKEILIGSSGPASSDSIHPNLANTTIGTKFKMIQGYSGSTEIHLALERGEVFGRCGFGYDSIVSRYKKWLDEKKINLLLQFALEKEPRIPEVPFIMDLITKSDDRKLATLLIGPNSMGRPIFGPPGIPADRVKILREAFNKAMVDPALLAEAKKMRLAISVMKGEAVEALVNDMVSSPKSVVMTAQKMLSGK